MRVCDGWSSRTKGTREQRKDRRKVVRDREVNWHSRLASRLASGVYVTRLGNTSSIFHRDAIF